MAKQIVRVKVVGIWKDFPECQDDICAHKRECANHRTAGDFRMEDGATPDLTLVGAEWMCSKEPDDNVGAIQVDGTLAR